MGMVCVLQPIDAGEIDGVLEHPETIHTRLEQGAEGAIDIDKSWHAIHFLLTGTAWDGTDPDGFLLQGGEQVGDEDVSYGPPRILRPHEVQRVHAFLKTIDSAELRRRYDPKAMVRAEIYPDIWDREDDMEENFEYVSQYFEDLRRFFAGAAQKEHGVAIFIT